MGVNYYLRLNCCEKRGRSDSVLHIGKSSAGWTFSLHVFDDEQVGKVESLEDWKKLFRSGLGKIFDEFDREISKQRMLHIITKRNGNGRWEKKPAMYSSWADFHRVNCSQKGPNGLVRSRVDGGHCVGHGKGTWDLIAGEFS